MAKPEYRGPYQWRAKVRRKGHPVQTKTCATEAKVKAWARDIESQMDKGIFVDRSKAERETLGDVILPPWRDPNAIRRCSTACMGKFEGWGK